MRLEKYRSPLAFALALLLPALVFRAHLRGPDRANGLDNAVLIVTAPVQELLIRTVGIVSDAWHHYIFLSGSAQRATDLQLEVHRLERRLANLEVLELENEHLRRLLELELHNTPEALLTARVIGTELGPSSRVLRINRGSLHGLARGAPVVTPKGLAGRLLEVAWSSSELQLLSDPRMTVPVRILRNGARGRLSGHRAPDQQGRLLLDEVLRSDDINVGDLVVTSGLGRVYPPNVPIGRVLKVLEVPGRPHRQAIVEPHVALDRVEWVEVLTRSENQLELATPEPLLPPELQLP